MSLVSVIVPCFNQAAYVAKAVGSALASSHRLLEVIVVDDGSSDDPASALRIFADDPRLRLLRQPNAGVAAARNLAIAQARGDWFHFLDADDWIDPDMLSSLVAEFAADPRLGMAYCDITHVDDAGHRVDDYSVGHAREELDGDLLPSLLLGGYFPPVCMVVSRKAIDAAGNFDPPLGGCCDWDLWARIAALGFTARYVDRKLAFYRLHDSSMSQDVAHMTRTMRHALEKLLRHYPDRAAEAIHALIHRTEALFRSNAELVQSSDGLSTALAWHEQQVRLHATALREAEEHIGAVLRQAAADRETASGSLQDARGELERLVDAQRWSVEQQRALEEALAKSDAAWRDSQSRVSELDNIVAGLRAKGDAVWRDSQSRMSELDTIVGELRAENARLQEALADAGLRHENDARTMTELQSVVGPLRADAEHHRHYLASLDRGLIARTLMQWHLLPRFAAENTKDEKT